MYLRHAFVSAFIVSCFNGYGILHHLMKNDKFAIILTIPRPGSLHFTVSLFGKILWMPGGIFFFGGKWGEKTIRGWWYRDYTAGSKFFSETQQMVSMNLNCWPWQEKYCNSWSFLRRSHLSLNRVLLFTKLWTHCIIQSLQHSMLV